MDCMILALMETDLTDVSTIKHDAFGNCCHVHLDCIYDTTYFWELISWHLDPIYFSYRNCGIVINGISSQEILSKSSNPIYDVCGKGSIEHFNPKYNIMGIDLIGNSTPIYDAYGNCSHDILISFYN